MKPVGSMDQTVTTWEEGRRIDTQNLPSLSVPIRRAETTNADLVRIRTRSACSQVGPCVGWRRIGDSNP